MNKTNPELQAALDARLEEALLHAKFRVSLTTQKKNIKLKLDNALIYAFGGGTFQITQQLIAFTSALLAADRQSAVLSDVNDNPIQITDLADFHENIIDTYSESMNEYLIEIKNLNKARSTKALIGE